MTDWKQIHEDFYHKYELKYKHIFDDEYIKWQKPVYGDAFYFNYNNKIHGEIGWHYALNLFIITIQSDGRMINLYIRDFRVLEELFPNSNVTELLYPIMEKRIREILARAI